MTRPLFALGFLFVACAASPELTMHDGPPALLSGGRIGLVLGPAKRQLTAEWDSLSRGSVAEVERAYCVASYSQLAVPLAGHDTLRVDLVTDLSPAGNVRATRWSVQFQCPADADHHAMPSVHTHPPTMCDPIAGECQADSSRMTVATCVPSQQDIQSVTAAKAPFGIVQCGRDVWRFFGPSQPAAQQEAQP